MPILTDFVVEPRKLDRALVLCLRLLAQHGRKVRNQKISSSKKLEDALPSQPTALFVSGERDTDIRFPSCH